MNKYKLWITITAVAAMVFAAVAFFFTSTNAAGAVETTKVVTLEQTETVETTGALESQPFAALNWKTGGVIASVKAKPGQAVKKGDVLLTLQPDSTSASIASAQADLVAAQQNLEDLINSDSELAQALIDLRDAEQDFKDKSGYLKYLQTNQRVPLTETRGWYEKGKMGGWTYVFKTRYYRGPATPAMLAEAENNLELARATMEDLQREVERLTNKEQDILAAQAKVDAAQATVNSMQIVAPFDGEVLSVEDRVGDVVNAGALSVNLADMSRLYVEAQVDESDVAKIRAGNPVRVTLDALPEVELSGAVEFVNPVGEAVSGLVKYSVRVALDEADDAPFIPLGSTANVSITVRDSSAVLAAPITAIQSDEQGEYVLVLRGDGSSERISVVSGSIVGDLVVVNGELREGDELLLAARESGFRAPNPFGGSHE